MTNDIIDIAINNINDMININVSDMAKGAVYVRNHGILCLSLINLVKELEDRKTPVKKVKKK